METLVVPLTRINLMNKVDAATATSVSAMLWGYFELKGFTYIENA